MFHLYLAQFVSVAFKMILCYRVSFKTSRILTNLQVPVMNPALQYLCFLSWWAGGGNNCFSLIDGICAQVLQEQMEMASISYYFQLLGQILQSKPLVVG